MDLGGRHSIMTSAFSLAPYVLEEQLVANFETRLDHLVHAQRLTQQRGLAQVLLRAQRLQDVHLGFREVERHRLLRAHLALSTCPPGSELLQYGDWTAKSQPKMPQVTALD